MTAQALPTVTGVNDERYQRQYELECWCRSVGAERALKPGWQVAAGGYLVSCYHESVAKVVDEFWEKSLKGGTVFGNVRSVVGSKQDLIQCVFETMYWLASNEFVSTFDQGKRITLAAQIGKRCEFILFICNEKLWGKYGTHINHLRQISGDMELSLVKRRLRDKKFRLAAEYRTLSAHERIALGALVIEILTIGTDLLQREKRTGFKKTWVAISWTDKYYEFLKRWEHSLEVFRPALTPMIAPPLDWKDQHEGGFYSLRLPFSPVEPGSYDKLINPGIYQAANTLQAVPFVFDHQQVQFARDIWDRNIAMDGLPKRDRMDMPRQDENLKLGRTNPEFWRLHWQYIEDRNRDSIRVKFCNSLITYEKIKDETLYHVWTQDYRGRLYPKTGALSQTSQDVFRTMLAFEQKSPVRGHIDSFAWCIGETMGWEKDQRQRERLLKDNSAFINRCGQDPLETMDLWKDLKEPWRFVQMARDWAGYLADENYTTGTVYRLDQTCSGYGHVACLVGDKMLAERTNVIGDQYRDLYTEVSRSIMDLLPLYAAKEKTKTHDEMMYWLTEELDRELWKACIMPIIYGRTHHTLIRTINNWFVAKHKSFYEPGGMKSTFAARGLAAVIKRAVQSIMPGVRDLSRWVKEVGRAQVEAGLVPHWVTPDGLVVESFKRKEGKVQLAELKLSGRRIIARYEDKEGAEFAPSSNSCANFIHSFDAAFLREVVNEWGSWGTPLTACHDCFGTTLEYVRGLRADLRLQFKIFYTPDRLRIMRDYLQAEVGDRAYIPAPPGVRTLDRDQIGTNPYLFC